MLAQCFECLDNFKHPIFSRIAEQHLYADIFLCYSIAAWRGCKDSKLLVVIEQFSNLLSERPHIASYLTIDIYDDVLGGLGAIPMPRGFSPQLWHEGWSKTFLVVIGGNALRLPSIQELPVEVTGFIQIPLWLLHYCKVCIKTLKLERCALYLWAGWVTG